MLLAHFLQFLFRLCQKHTYLIYVALLPATEQQPVFDALEGVLTSVEEASNTAAKVDGLVSSSPSC